ncbi:protoheme IX farnesyltransferase [Lewinella marina]|uniref:Protoheme IX farnesyltransferase n=1 Tax=Neolewinella marina TaxID=438751 RepID=A0A2G0CIL4_9BACT|nr:heme o synthase [Neolewinella marina]NJB85059.1 protoheme IX farnesyltransferase [Neolewinella marina]PHK99798.1 protoheme IX farnesyltransferase [Neolewinella marina]
MKASTTSRTHASEFARRVSDLAALVKFRLSATVVLSSVLAYLVALESGGVSWWAVSVLTAGGFLTTAAANILNEVLEKDYDRQMERTRRRPLAEGRMGSSEALLLAGFASLGGISLLALFNPWTAILGMLSLVSYAFVYTPLKRVGPVAVVVGAVPGALPALIGCAAAEGAITGLGVTLFTIQFFWQLPHFYAIGYLGSADYRKAGFRLVPEVNGEVDVRTLGRDSILATAVLIPLSLLPYALGITGGWTAVVVVGLGLAFFYYALMFYRRPERSTALRMMFFSFAYLPLVFTAYWAGKLFLS